MDSFKMPDSAFVPPSGGQDAFRRMLIINAPPMFNKPDFPGFNKSEEAKYLAKHAAKWAITYADEVLAQLNAEKS